MAARLGPSQVTIGLCQLPAHTRPLPVKSDPRRPLGSRVGVEKLGDLVSPDGLRPLDDSQENSVLPSGSVMLLGDLERNLNV